jgi:hypothetical protein
VNHDEVGLGLSLSLRKEPPPERVVQNRLESAPLAMNGLVQETRNIGIESQCGSHGGIMMP